MPKPNTDQSFRAAVLISKYLRQQLTEKERDELEAWINTGDLNQELFRELTSSEVLEDELKKFDVSDTGSGWDRVQQKIILKQPVNDIQWKVWWQSAAAVFIFVFAGWLWTHQHRQPKPQVASTGTYGSDVLPGTRKAELILSDGTKVRLDAGADSMFSERGSQVHRASNGMVMYGKGATAVTAAWNTINIPNGGEYIVQFEDGSKVWLNSASSLRYPVKFDGKERRVELISGEAYFEVAKNKEKPFIVVTDRMEVQDIGTAFNVNSYYNPDSSNVVTLAEGKIRVTTKHKAVFAAPGQQVKAGLIETVLSDGDVESATAWKNGLFIFNNAPLSEVMNSLARWYDVKIEYDKSFSDKKFFTGEIKRNVPVSKLLQMMEMTGIARFRITHNTISVSIY